MIFFGFSEEAVAGVDGFTPPNRPDKSRPSKGSGFFSDPSGSGDPGKPDGSGSGADDENLPTFPKVESVETTEELVEHLYATISQLEEVSDSDSDLENEENNCQVEEQNNQSILEMAAELDPEHPAYVREIMPSDAEGRFDTRSCSKERFKSLAYDPIKGGYDRVSIDEAISTIQAESEGKLINPVRPTEDDMKISNLDFKVDGPGEWTHFDWKTPIGSDGLKLQNQEKSVAEQAYKIGAKIPIQKARHVGKENGPVSTKNVGHGIDLGYVPKAEKQLVKDNILKGAADHGCTEGIIFINDN